MIRWKKVEIENITQQMINDCFQTCFDSIRKSKDGFGLLSWEGNMPKSLYGKGNEINIEAELEKSEWQSEE